MRIHTASQQTISLWLPGKVVPKARPRINKKQAYLPSNYREWKQQAFLEILDQIGDRTSLPIAKARVEMVFRGAHRGDLDNLAGAILDVLVQAEVLPDDRLTCVPRLLVGHQPDGKIGAKITITELF